MNLKSVVQGLDADIEHWYEDQRNEGDINRNVMAVGLIMCEHMRLHFPLSEDKWFTGTQVSLLGGSRIHKILSHCGEDRSFASEGGRTSRGSQELARSFESKINGSMVAKDFSKLSDKDRCSVVDALQGRMVQRIQRDFFDRQRLMLEIDYGKVTRSAVDALLALAKAKGGNAIGAVAQHLVGAKLGIRHIEVAVENQSYTTADQQTGRFGDFMMNDTAIHVTISPTESLLRKCSTNIDQGYRPLILTPEDRISTAMSLADNIGISGRVAVRGLEDFIASNIDEMAIYSESKTRKVMWQLFDRYNDRVSAVEPDPSLLVEIPENLSPD